MNMQEALRGFATEPHYKAATEFLKCLGYHSDRSVDQVPSEPSAFLQWIHGLVPNARFDLTKALFEDWTSASLLFQITDEDLSRQVSLFQDNSVKPGNLKSYVFFAIELKGTDYARGKLTGLVRQLNRLFPMPVMVLIKHLHQTQPVLSIAVLNRRANKVDGTKDVLGKVTIIQGIKFEGTHTGHLQILDSLVFQNLKHPQRKEINSFDTLHESWGQIFNVELLNERFYRELSNWFFWAIPQVRFPSSEKSEVALIRLLTRLIFCWFLKEKNLIPDEIFVEAKLKSLLKSLDQKESTYHEAILQNLFFATLNQPMGQRGFAKDEGYQKNRANYGVDTLYRYEDHFSDGVDLKELLGQVPFLNGGLFECLDQTDDETERKVYVDGFSRNPKMRPEIPNYLFFAPEQIVDLSRAYGEDKRKREKVRGLVSILNSYKFTVAENTPLDQEIALDPELLGKVFENLLASYNPETKETARKQTGSFYTPRPIVDYIVDQALESYLARTIDDCERIKHLLSYSDAQPFNDNEQDQLLDAIHRCTILDPACGSGAFPMGALHKLVHIVHKLDPSNEKWKRVQLRAADAIPDAEARQRAKAGIEEAFAERQADYGRKLYLIENCLFGSDIQPIAIQISKLRCFISLVCDQTVRNETENRGIRPLPNLETKFVAANTLLSIENRGQMTLGDPEVEKVEGELERLYHNHFNIRLRREKLEIHRKSKQLRKKLGHLLKGSIGDQAGMVASWDPFNQQAVAEFFDPHWMFGKQVAEGFDIVIGNPPYFQIQKMSAADKAALAFYPGTKAKSVTRGEAPEKSNRYKTYDSMGDLYCLFYERGAQLLKPGGTLSYITSNKWMRAGYGESLRRYLATQVDTLVVFDFGMAQNFGAATTYTCITTFVKQASDGKIASCYASDDREAMADPARYFAEHATDVRVGADPWVILSPERQRIKEMVEVQGEALEKWAIRINYGIKTGYNDAFYITNDQKEAMERDDPRSAEVLVPLLTGGDIKRYGADWDGTWMINSHNGVKALGIPRVNLERDYPSVWRYVSQGKYRDKLVSRADQGDHWSNLRNCAYIAEFAKPKIIYQEIAVTLPFYFDTAGMSMDTTCFMITSDSESLPYLTAILNSSLFRCCFRNNFPEYSGNASRVKKIFMDKIPIRKPTDFDAALFGALVQLVQLAVAEGKDAQAQFLIDLIDACVMECYFFEHMKDKDLLFHDKVRQLLPEGSAHKIEHIDAFVQAANAPTDPIRNQLIRLASDSPDLLAVIKKEGGV